MLQHRQPLESSRNSSDDSAKGSDVDETLIALAVPLSHHCAQREMVARHTFDVLDKHKPSFENAETWTHTAVSPNSFMMTAIRYP
jgi:hypothetical protein